MTRECLLRQHSTHTSPSISDNVYANKIYDQISTEISICSKYQILTYWEKNFLNFLRIAINAIKKPTTKITLTQNLFLFIMVYL